MFPKTFDMLSRGAGVAPIAGGLPNAGGAAVAPNAVPPNPPPNGGFEAPNAGGDPNTGLVSKEGAWPKAVCPPNTGCSIPSGDALAPTLPNTDGDPGEVTPALVLVGGVPPKKDPVVYDVPPNIEPDF